MATIEIAPEAIDRTFVPLARTDVAAVSVGPEFVLGRVASGTSYLQTCALNESGTIVWQCFDGSGTIDEIAFDIAEVFGADAEAVVIDVVELARQVGAMGFLVGVEEQVLEVDDTLTGLPVGSPFPDFEADDDAGATVTIEAILGRRTLLVSWSPTCSFCALIAPDLAALAPALAANGIDIVLLAIGRRAANRALLTRAQLSARLLLQTGEVAEGFDGMGTPVAYLVDEAGRIAQPLAVGSTEVATLATSLAHPALPNLLEPA